MSRPSHIPPTVDRLRLPGSQVTDKLPQRIKLRPPCSASTSLCCRLLSDDGRFSEKLSDSRSWPVEKLCLAALMSGPDQDKMGTRSNEHRILVIGKAGNGKSALCNALTGGQTFALGRGMSATTRTVQHHDFIRYGYQIRVVDTPDVTNINLSSQDMVQEVSRWRQATHPYPTAVLLAVRCDIRYTAEEHAIYREIHRLWGDNSLKERLVVVFTFGDHQDMPLEEELKMVCPELKSVLRDAANRYILFDNKAPTHEKEARVQQLLNLVETSALQSQGKPNYVLRGMAAASLFFGLCFAATYTANKSGAAIAFGLLCLLTGGGVLLLRIKEKMN